MSEILKELERDIDKRRKDQDEREKKHLLSQLGDKGVNTSNFSRDIMYIAVIVLLVSYVAYDRIFVHPSLSLESRDDVTSLVAKNADIDAETTTTTLAEETTTTTTTTLAEETTTTTVEKPKLSGSVNLQLLDINSEKTSDTTGQIQSVIFTIENGLGENIYPVVNVYAYDDNLEEEWRDISRGKYNLDKSIKVAPGETHTGTVFLTPKTFSNLELIKTVELSLKYADGEDEIRVKSKIKIE